MKFKRSISLPVLALLGATLVSVGGVGSAAASTGGYHPVTNYLSYVGGKAGAANPKRSPIDIGVINQQGGSEDIAPEWTNGTTIAADLINKDLGGIDGHPVKLVTCFIPDTVASASQCGQQMANDSKVQSVVVGAVAIGNQAMEQAIEPTGKVLVWGISLSPVDTVYKPGFVLFGDGTHVEAPLATFAKQYLHAKTVAIVYTDIPGASVGADIIAAALKAEGVGVKVVGYDPSTTDLTGPITAAGAATASLFIADAEGSSACTDMYKSVQQLDIKTPVLANVPCDSAQVATGDGGTLPIGWYYASAVPLPGDPGDPSLAAFTKVADEFGQGQWAKDTWVANSFGQTLTMAKWDTEVLKAGKPLTAKNIDAVAKVFKGPVVEGPPTLVCGSFAAAPAICNDKDSFFQNTSPGVFKAIVRFLGPPAGFKIPSGLQ